MQKKIHVCQKIISQLLVFIFLLNSFIYADPDIVNSKKRSLEFLAPRSNFRSSIVNEYGVSGSAYGKISEKGVIAGERRVTETNKKTFRVPGWLKKIPEFIVRTFKKLKMKSLFPVMFFAAMIFTATDLGAQTQDYDARVRNYQEFISFQIEEGIDASVVRDNVFREILYSTDPAIQQASIDLAVRNWPGDIDSVFNNPDISVDLLKDILMARFYNGSTSDLVYLSDFVQSTGDSVLFENQQELFAFALSLAKSELLSTETAFADVATKDAKTFSSMMNLLVIVIETESENSIIRSQALKRFQAGFRSNDDLAAFILSFDDSIDSTDIITRPFVYSNNQLRFAHHSLSYLRDAAEEELKSRIALTHLTTRGAKKYLGSEFIENFVEGIMGGSNKSFVPFMLSSVQNHVYPAMGMERFLPDIHEKVMEQYEATILSIQNKISTDQLFIENLSPLRRGGAEFSSLSNMISEFNVLRNEAVERIAEHEAAYFLINSDNPNLRLEARNIIKDDILSLMHLYLSPVSNENDREYASRRIELLLRDQSSSVMQNGIATARANQTFRSGLIELFRNSQNTDTKIYCLNIYLRSSNDLGELIAFEQQLIQGESVDGLEAGDFALLEEGLNNEIKRAIAVSILSRRVGIENSSTSAITFHNKPFEIIEIEQYISSLNNPNSNINEILPAEIMQEVNNSYERLRDEADNQNKIIKSLTDNYGLLSFLILAVMAFFTTFIKRAGRLLVNRKANDRSKNIKNKKIQDIEPRDRVGDFTYIADSKDSEERISKTIKRKLKGKEIIVLLDKLIKNTNSFTKEDAKKFHSYMNFHSRYSVISAATENRIIHTLVLSMVDKKINDPEVNKYLQNVLNILLYKIKEQSFSTPSSPEGAVELDTEKEEEKYENKSFITKVIDGLKGKTLLSADLIEKVGAVDKNFKKMFADKFNQTRKKMILVVLILTSLQFGLLFLPSLLVMFTAAPISLIVIWAGVIFIQVVLEGLKLYFSEKTSYEVDKSLKILLQTASAKYKIGGLPTTKNISQGVKARWGLIQLIASSLPISLAILAIQPIFFVPFMLAFMLCLGIVLYNTFHKNGLAEALEDYEKEMDSLGKRWSIFNYLSKSYDIDGHSAESVKKFKRYIKKSISFSVSLLLLITFVIPGIAFLAGFTAYGIVVSGYLGFMLIAFDPIKRMTKGIFHVQKLRKMVDYIHEQEMFKWEYEWKTKRAECEDSYDYLSNGWHIQSIIGDNISIFAPNKNEKSLLINQNFEFHKGNRITFAAFSGAGKSQTAKTLGFVRPHNGGKYKVRIKNETSGEEKILEASPENFDLDNLREKIHYNDLKSYSENTLKEMLLFNNGIDTIEIKKMQSRMEYLSSKRKIQQSKKEVEELNELHAKLHSINKMIYDIEKQFIEEHGRSSFNDEYSDNDAKILNFTKSELKLKLNQPIKDFSDGEQLRIKLALIFSGKAKEADFVILDEPFAKIQSNLKVKISTFVKEWQKKYGAGVIIIDHHPRDEMESDIVVSFSNSQLIDYQYIEVQSDLKDVIDDLGLELHNLKKNDPLDEELLIRIQQVFSPDYNKQQRKEHKSFKKVLHKETGHSEIKINEQDVNVSVNAGKNIASSGISDDSKLMAEEEQEKLILHNEDRNETFLSSEEDLVTAKENSEGFEALTEGEMSISAASRDMSDIVLEEKKLQLEEKQLNLDQRKLDHAKKIIELEERKKTFLKGEIQVEQISGVSDEKKFKQQEKSSSVNKENNNTYRKNRKSDRVVINEKNEKEYNNQDQEVIEQRLSLDNRDDAETDRSIYSLNKNTLLSFAKNLPDKILFSSHITNNVLSEKFIEPLNKSEHDVFCMIEGQYLFMRSLLADEPFAEVNLLKRNIMMNFLKMKVRFDALETLSLAERYDYISALKRSSDYQNVIFAEVLEELLLKNKENICNIKLKFLYKDYINRVMKDDSKQLQVLREFFRNKINKGFIEKIIENNNNLIYNQLSTAVECLFEFNKKPSRLPKTFNVNDLFMIISSLNINNVAINGKMPKIFFQYKWHTLKNKIDLANRYALPLNSTNLKLFKTRNTPIQNETDAISKAMVLRLRELAGEKKFKVKDLAKNNVHFDEIIKPVDFFKWQSLYEFNKHSHGYFAKIFFNLGLNERFEITDEEEVIIFNKLMLDFDKMFGEDEQSIDDITITSNSDQEKEPASRKDNKKLEKSGEFQAADRVNSKADLEALKINEQDKNKHGKEQSEIIEKQNIKSEEDRTQNKDSYTLPAEKKEQALEIPEIKEESSELNEDTEIISLESRKRSPVIDSPRFYSEEDGESNKISTRDDKQQQTFKQKEAKHISKKSLLKGFKVMAMIVLFIILPVTLILTSCSNNADKHNTVIHGNMQTLQTDEMQSWNSRIIDENSAVTDTVVSEKSINASFVLTGNLNTVRSEFDGRVVSKVPNGTHVNAGEVLITYVSANSEIEAEINDLRQLYNDQLNEYNLAVARRNFDVAQTEVDFLEIQKNSTFSRLNDLIARYAGGTVTAAFDGVFFDRTFFSDDKTTPEIGENFTSGADLGYLRPDVSEQQELTVTFRTSDIYSVFVDGRDSPAIELLIDGEKILAEVRGGAELVQSFNLDYTFSCVIPHTAVEMNDVSDVRVVVQEKELNELTINTENFHQLNGIAYYPEKMDWNFSYAGIIRGIPDSSYTGYASVSTLDAFRVINHELLTFNSGDRELLNHYLGQYNAFKELYGVNAEVTLEAYQKYNELVSRVNQRRNIMEASSFDLHGIEDWVISDINIRNGEFLPARSRDSKNEAFLEIVNPNKVYVNARAGYELLDTLNNYQDLYGVMPMIVVQAGERQFNAVIRERHVDVNEGILNITFEINSEHDNFIIPFENAPVKIFIETVPLDSTANVDDSEREASFNSASNPVSESLVLEASEKDENDSTYYTEASMGLLLGFLGFKKSKKKKGNNSAKKEEENSLAGIYGTYALLSLFSLMKKNDQDLNKALVSTLNELLKSGYSLKKKGEDSVGLKEIKRALNQDKRSLTALLARVLPKDIALALAAELIKSDYIYLENHFKEFRNKNKTSDIDNWPLITDPLFSPFSKAFDTELYYWLDNWLKWLPEKINAVGNSEKKIKMFLSLDFIVIDPLLKILNEKINNSAEDCSKTAEYKKRILIMRDAIIAKKEVNTKNKQLIIKEIRKKVNIKAAELLELHLSDLLSVTELSRNMLDFWEKNPLAFEVEEFAFLFESIEDGLPLMIRDHFEQDEFARKSSREISVSS